MWDWELLKNGEGKHRYEILSTFSDESFQYTHAVSYGTAQDDYCLHSHAMYEIVLCVDGDVVYLADGKRYPIEPGSLLILSPAVPHKLFVCSDKPFERHVLYVSFAWNASPLSAMIAQCQHPIFQKGIGSSYYEPDVVAQLHEDFRKIGCAAGSKKNAIRALTPAFVQAMVADMMMTMDGIMPTRFTHDVSKPTDHLTLFLAQNCTKALTLQMVADAFSISKDYCNHIFHKSTGMSVMQYVNYCRILYAKQLLANGTPALEAAHASGFSDYSNFFRAYRKITGRAPSDDYKIAGGVLKIPGVMEPNEER